MNQQNLSAILQLASPALPIGGFSYSQGFESAVDCGLVKSPSEAQSWITNHLHHVFANCEALVWVYLYEAWKTQDMAAIQHWNNWFWASRETSEFRLETEQMGWSLAKLAKELGWGDSAQQENLMKIIPVTLPCAHSYASVTQGLLPEEALHAYHFSWLENQVMAAIKTIPLGQVAGQKILHEVRKGIPDLVRKVLASSKAKINKLNTFAPQLSILSARHENQYSRLFRS